MNEIYAKVLLEIHKAGNTHGKFHSTHEAYAVALEEFDELWEEIKKEKSHNLSQRGVNECIQVIACLFRMIDECKPKSK